MNNHYSRKNMYSLSLAADRILKSLSCPIFKTHFSHKTTESAGRCYPPWSEQKTAGWTLLLWPFPTYASLNFQLSCCAICSPVPAQLPGEQTGSLAHWMEQGCLYFTSTTKETGRRITVCNHSEVLTENHLYPCSWAPSSQAPVKHCAQLGFIEQGDAHTLSLSKDYAPALGLCTFSSRVSVKA